MKRRIRIICYFLLALIVPSILPAKSFGQATSCTRDFAQIVEKVIHDYAGYADKTRSREKQISELIDKTRVLTSKTRDFEECTKILQQWVNSFHDGHLFLVVKGSETVETQNFSVEKENLKPSFKILDNDSVLLKIPAFDLNYKVAIDDLIKLHSKEITSTRNLILDLRGNKGGGDSSFRNLIPLIYTNPIKFVGTSIWASKGNIDFYKTLIQNETFPEEVKQQLRQSVTKMEANPSQFVATNPDGEVRLDVVYPLPQNVAIVIDKFDGSTTEQFLLAAKQSSKVILFGKTNTAGILDYANVTNTELQSGKRILFVPSSRSRRLPENPVDGIGIPPNIKIPKNVKEEIAYVEKYLKGRTFEQKSRH